MSRSMDARFVSFSSHKAILHSSLSENRRLWEGQVWNGLLDRGQQLERHVGGGRILPNQDGLYHGHRSSAARGGGRVRGTRGRAGRGGVRVNSAERRTVGATGNGQSWSWRTAISWCCGTPANWRYGEAMWYDSWIVRGWSSCGERG